MSVDPGGAITIYAVPQVYQHQGCDFDKKCKRKGMVFGQKCKNRPHFLANLYRYSFNVSACRSPTHTFRGRVPPGVLGLCKDTNQLVLSGTIREPGCSNVFVFVVSSKHLIMHCSGEIILIPYSNPTQTCTLCI